jgi:hypothetical protein
MHISRPSVPSSEERRVLRPPNLSIYTSLLSPEPRAGCACDLDLGLRRGGRGLGRATNEGHYALPGKVAVGNGYAQEGWRGSGDGPDRIWRRPREVIN